MTKEGPPGNIDPINTPIEQLEQQKLKELLGIIDSIIEGARTNSEIPDQFMELFNDKNINFRDYYLAGVFIARVKGEEIPPRSNYVFYDIEGGKIEKYIKGLKPKDQQK